jgi:TetR/AcrR family transcriptional regulator
VRTSGPARGRRRAAPPDEPRDTRRDVFLAAAHAFSERGYNGVGVDDIAREARVNKAMIYYHFKDKLTLYREIVRDMLRETGVRLTAIADDPGPADRRIGQFIDAFAELKESRAWLPTLMLREMAEGAPHLDLETLGMMRTVFGAFGRIVADGQAQGLFRRDVHPVLAYLSVVGPLLLDSARQRAAAAPGRSKLPMFVHISRAQLVSHLQDTALRMLAKASVRKPGD